MQQIDNPKVFISYAWGTEKYQQKVLDFAKTLKSDGIQVIIDKWAVIGGHDLYNFMEKSVKDETVTNVLILLDPEYARKADAREGGVGTETQIISQEVYASVEQDKFIPIIFERDADGNICKPVFLTSRFHYDLSQDDIYDVEYKKLGKHLYGRELYIEPELGSKPSWIDEEIEIAPKKHVSFESLKEKMPLSVKADKFRSYLDKILEDIIEFGSETTLPDNLADYIASYDKNRPIRAEYLELISYYHYLENSAVQIGDFFETLRNRLEDMNNDGREFALIFLHELFIYTVAVFLKQKDYKSAAYLLGRTYFITRYSDPRGQGYSLFYSGRYHTNLDTAVDKRDGVHYYSGTAEHWLNTIDITFCTKSDFILADEICCNYSVYGKDYASGYRWFPVTYMHDIGYKGVIKDLSCRLSSKEKLTQILVLFNYEDVDEFKQKFLKINERIHSGDLRNYGFNEAFENIPLLGHFIKAEELGTMR